MASDQQPQQPTVNVNLGPSVQSHEDRLQRVESHVTQIAVSVAQISTLTGTISESIKAGFEELKTADKDLADRLGDQRKALDEQGKDLTAKLQGHADALRTQAEAHAEIFRAHDGRIKPIEANLAETRVTTKKRRDRVKAFVIGTLLAGAGAFVTKAAEALWSRF